MEKKDYQGQKIQNMKQTDFFARVDSKTPGYAVTVVKDGKTVLMRTAGLADMERKIPIATKTAFRLASLSKQFTAMAAMILAERKKLNLEDKLTDFFSDYPAYGNKVTIKQLLTHTAGIPDHEKRLYKLINRRKNIWGYDRSPKYTEPAIYDALEVLKTEPNPLFQPGTQYKYSDAGYVLLALIIEKVSGVSYREFLRQNIFSPLAMADSDVLDQTKPEIKNRALGYSVCSKRSFASLGMKKQSFGVFDYDPLNYIVGDEGVYSSVEDMIKWSQAWDEEILVSRKSLAAAMAPARLTNGKYGKAGFSWLIKKYRGTNIIYQDGSWVGFRNIILKIPGQRLTVITLSNRTDLDTEQKRISLACQLAQKFV